VKHVLWAIFFFIPTMSFCQEVPTPSVQAKSSGTCSPNIIANRGIVKFTCNAAIDEGTAQKIVSVLNQVLRKEKDSAGMNDKLDQILALLQTQAHETEQLRSELHDAVPPDRTLTNKQASAVARVFGTFPSTVKVVVKTPDGNSEAQRYAQQFQDIANQTKKAGNPVVILGMFWRPIPVGLYVLSHSDNDIATAYRDVLVEALSSSGAALTSYGVADWVEAGQVMIVVGVQR
jgi:hypothetical protein